ncbi:MAG: hypothetical protein Q7J64_04645, partial [Elusimicrobiota bacterium]|nr:hypothetical protein [Elusimicrobiota bacterium]
MKNLSRVLAGGLAFLVFAFAPGLAPYQAAAQVINGAPARGGGVPTVPVFGPNGAVLAPLSPASFLAPSLTGGFAPSMGAPTPSLSQQSVFSAASIPALPVSAITLAARLAPAASVETKGAASVTPATSGEAVDAKAHLAIASEQLSAASSEEKTGVLDSFFTGARSLYGRLTGSPSLTASGRDTSSPSGSVATAQSDTIHSVSAPTPLALVGTGLQPGDKFLTASAADEKAQVPAPAPAAPGDVDAATGAKAIKWMYIQDAISMSAFIMTSIAYPMVVIPAVGSVTFGVLMALGPLAAIALGPLSGMIATRFAPREGLAILSGIRAVLTVALPIMALTGMISFWPLLIASVANGWQFSLLMTSRSAYTRRFAITDPKQSRSWMHIGNLTTIGFSIYFLLQVMLGSIGQIGGLIDAMDPMMPFWIATAMNVGLVFLNYWKIPKISNIVSNAAAAVKAAAEPFTKKAAA